MVLYAASLPAMPPSEPVGQAQEQGAHSIKLWPAAGCQLWARLTA